MKKTCINCGREHTYCIRCTRKPKDQITDWWMNAKKVNKCNQDKHDFKYKGKKRLDQIKCQKCGTTITEWMQKDLIIYET